MGKDIGDTVVNQENQEEDKNASVFDVWGKLFADFDVKSLIVSYRDLPTSNDEIECAIRCDSETDWRLVSFTMTRKELSNKDMTIHAQWGVAFEDEALVWQNAAKYDSLTKAHNDLSYNRKTLIMVNSCLYRRTIGIHVVSDVDYDEAHPAGTYLDDIMCIRFTSAEDYLATG